MPRIRDLKEPLYRGVPGRIITTVEAFEEGDPRYQEVLPDGSVIAHGVPLGVLRAKFGGDEGEVTDVFYGQKHRISLKPWASVDPQRTHIAIKFYFVPDDPSKVRPVGG
jgi:hypothetical protein